MIAGTLATLPLARAGTIRQDPSHAADASASADATARARLSSLLDASDGRPADEETEAVEAAVAARAEELARPVPLATVDGVRLVVPTPPQETALVGFHEATGPRARPLQPSGPITADHNARADVEEGPEAADAPAHAPTTVVLPGRARGTDPASAVDIAVPTHVPIAAPVSGTIVDVHRYALYGRHPDTRIEIEPTDRPDLRVIVLHVSDPLVGPGEPVTAGETPLAQRSTAFPFASQIDRFTADPTGDGAPHVHIEVVDA